MQLLPCWVLAVLLHADTAASSLGSSYAETSFFALGVDVLKKDIGHNMRRVIMKLER